MLYAYPYMMIYLIGTLPSMIAVGMNPFINAQGYSVTGMSSVVVGAAANLILDPVFIFILGLGVRGAAIATVLSQTISAIFVYFFLSRRAELKVRLLRREEIGVCSGYARNIVSLGMAGFIMQLTNSLVSICCNHVLSVTGGDIYISVMTIVSSVRQLVETPISAMNEGTSPILSYNYGARRPGRVRKAMVVLAVMILLYTAVMWGSIIVIPEVLTIKELADKMKIVPSVIVKKLFLQGKVVTVNQEIDYDTAEEIAMEFEVLCEKEEVVDVIEELLKEEEEDENMMVKRPPVVCVMGHVDHGKTSLLDAIRHSNVIDREAGGITQHIGAYVVEANGEKITFLDTPGHEAFTAMRMRGASSTDIAILVVAADDGVMPQTVEAINHAKAAGIEIIVAINKIDKPSANIERVKQELTEYELIPEDWGGSTIFVPVSAHTKEGIPELLEMVLLTAEVMELKANPNRAARGLVIEAELDKGKGSVATVLVQKGTLHVGDAIAAGSAHGRVRAMMDDKGRRVKEAGPSQPVEILGLNDVPNAGEVFVGCDSEKDARSFAETFIAQNKVKLLDETKSRMSLDDLFSQIQEGNLKELNIIVKADVQGSVEAIKQSLLKLSNDEVVIKIIHGGVGAINESDVSLASASNAIIIGFNVRPDATAKEIADREGVDLRLYRVIYNAIEDVEAAMKGMLDPVFEEKILGHAEVRQTFKASGVGTIAGSYVQDGIFERNCSVRLIRDGIVVFDGPLASLKRFKDDVKEVRAGYECGFVFENYNDIKEGDQVEAYKMVETERK